MKKKIFAAIASALAIAVIVPATSFASPATTEVTGNVTNGGSPVKGAQVTVTCNGIKHNVLTNSSGTYLATYLGKKCPEGSTITVSATKHSLSGSSSGTAGFVTTKLNVAMINVALPEFGIITATIAVATAAGTLFVVRRRQLGSHKA